MIKKNAQKKTGKFKKAAIFVGAYAALWGITALIGGVQVRSKVESWKIGTTGVTGNLRIGNVSTWSPGPFVVVAEKNNIGIAVSFLAGSTETQHVEKRWFFWLLVPIEFGG